MLTPLQLTVLIQSYTTREALPLINNPEWQEQTRELISSGLIELDNSVLQTFTLTARGEKFLQMILETPLPELKWVDPRKPIILPMAVETTPGDLTVLDKPAFLRKIMD